MLHQGLCIAEDLVATATIDGERMLPLEVLFYVLDSAELEAAAAAVSIGVFLVEWAGEEQRPFHLLCMGGW